MSLLKALTKGPSSSEPAEFALAPNAMTNNATHWSRYTPTGTDPTELVTDVDEPRGSLDDYGMSTATASSPVTYDMDNDTEGGTSSGCTIYVELGVGRIGASQGTYTITVELLTDDGLGGGPTSRGTETISTGVVDSDPDNFPLTTSVIAFTNAGWDVFDQVNNERDSAQIRVTLTAVAKFNAMIIGMVELEWTI